MLRNVGSNWVLTASTIVATYLLTPFIIHRLGQEGYGTWSLVVAITGYMNLMALGVPMACVRYLAEEVAEGDTRQMNATIGSAAGLYLMIGAAALVCGGVLLAVFGAVYHVPAAWSLQAHLALALMVIQLSAGFIGLLPEGIMFAHHDFVSRNVVRVSGLALRVGLTIALLSLSPSLVLLALVQLLCLAFDVGASLLLIRRRYPHLRVRLSDFEWRTVRRIFAFSMHVLLLSAGARLSFETDALVIGARLSVSAIPFYAVANSMIVYLMDFVIAIAAVVSPMASKLNAERRPTELAAMFLRWSKVAASISIAAGLFLIVLGPTFIGWWIDRSYEEPSGAVLRILMVSSFLFLPARGVALPVLMGIGKPRTATISFIAAGLLNLALSIVMARPLGLSGVALGTAIPNLLFAAVVVTVACRELRVPLALFCRYAVVRPALGGLPVLAVLIWFKSGLRVEGIIGVAAAGLTMTAVAAVTWLMFVYRGDPFVDARPFLARIRMGTVLTRGFERARPAAFLPPQPAPPLARPRDEGVAQRVL
jgi:O-antigen/teichoic acid export membrane protein